MPTTTMIVIRSFPPPRTRAHPACNSRKNSRTETTAQRKSNLSEWRWVTSGVRRPLCSCSTLHHVKGLGTILKTGRFPVFPQNTRAVNWPNGEFLMAQNGQSGAVYEPSGRALRNLYGEKKGILMFLFHHSHDMPTHSFSAEVLLRESRWKLWDAVLHRFTLSNGFEVWPGERPGFPCPPPRPAGDIG